MTLSLWIPAHLFERSSLETESSQRLADAVAGIRREPAGSIGPIPEIDSSSSTGEARAHPLTAFELLHTLGRVTSSLPSQVATLRGMATTTSGHWAIVRYLWAFASSGSSGNLLRLDPITDYVRYHQRTHLSEQMGIAAAIYLIERQVVMAGGESPNVADVDVAFQDPLWQPILKRIKRRQRPDYIVAFGDPSATGTVLGIVECKGTSGGRQPMLKQLARGVTQVRSLVPTTRPSRHFVIGTTLAGRLVRTHAIEDLSSRPRAQPASSGDITPPEANDPIAGPPEPRPTEPGSPEWDPDTAVELGEDFTSRRIPLAESARLLAFAGAYDAAASRTRGEPVTSASALDRESRVYDQEVYRGVTIEVRAPDGALQVYCGVEADLLEAEATDSRGRAREARIRLAEVARSRGEDGHLWHPTPSGRESRAVASPDGCLTEVSWTHKA